MELRNYVYFCYFFSLIGSTSILHAQSKEYWGLHRVQDKATLHLAELGINAMVDTDSGDLWLASSKGLFLHNGYTLEQFCSQIEGVTALTRLPDGRIFAMDMHNMAFLVYPTQNDSFACSPLFTLSDTNILRVVASKNHNGFYYWLASEYNVHIYRNNTKIAKLTFPNGVKDIRYLGSVVSVVSGQEIYFCHENGRCVVHTFFNNVTHFYKIGGDQWYGTETNGLWIQTGKTIRQVLKGSIFHLHPAANNPSTLFAATDEGIFLVNARNHHTTTLSTGKCSLGLTGDHVIWCADTQNLFRAIINPDGFRFYSKENSLLHSSDVRDISELDNGQIAILNGSNISFFNQGKLQFNLETKDQWITKIERATHNEIWILSEEKNLSLYNYVDHKMRTFKPLPFPPNEIADLFSTPSGVVYIASTKGLFILKTDGSLQPSTFRPADIRLVTLDREDLILHLQDEGIWRFRPKENTYHRIISFPCGSSVRGMFTDAQRRIWIGTEKGLFYLQKSSCEQAPHWPKERRVRALSGDAKNGLWVVGENTFFSPELYRINLSKPSWFPVSLPWLNDYTGYLHNLPSIQGKNGHIYFLGQLGLLEINTQINHHDLIDFSGIQLFARDKVVPIKQVAHNVFEVREVLPHYQNDFSFSFRFLDHESVSMAYKLVDWMPNWALQSGDTPLKFGGLLPGTYELYVYISQRNGQWSSKPLQIKFQINPPWWMQPISRLLFFSVLVLLGWWGNNRWNHAKRKREENTLALRKSRQEAKEMAIVAERERLEATEKLREAAWQAAETRRKDRKQWEQDLHDELGGQLGAIKNRLQVLKKQPEAQPLKDTLIAIVDEVTDASKQLRHSRWMVDPTADYAEAVVGRIVGMAVEMLSGLRLDLDYPEEVPNFGIDFNDRKNLILAIKEAFHNILKHAHASIIHLFIRLQDGVLYVSIQDDGSGFDPSLISSGGHGLRNMQERLAASGGRCTLTSIPKKGTKIVFELPLK
ncbi:MAG: hypothetical protein J0L94_04265 [Rhodothermia bacterium]|nr:hypothetical protein [Rhodothermia bacterium]